MIEIVRHFNLLRQGTDHKLRKSIHRSGWLLLRTPTKCCKCRLAHDSWLSPLDWGLCRLLVVAEFLPTDCSSLWTTLWLKNFRLYAGESIREEIISMGYFEACLYPSLLLTLRHNWQLTWGVELVWLSHRLRTKQIFITSTLDPWLMYFVRVQLKPVRFLWSSRHSWGLTSLSASNFVPNLASVHRLSNAFWDLLG